MNTGYKFLTADMKSKNGDSGVWKMGEWKKHEDELVMCESGFHYCKKSIEAFEYVYGDALVVVEARGKSETEGNKTVVAEMRVIKRVDTKKVSVQFAIACARRCLPNYEKAYPKDDRPRKAIDAAEAWCLNPTEETARSAARPAAESAESAAWSAAAPAARSAAWSAESAAAPAARSAARSASAERKWQNETLKSIIEESPSITEAQQRTSSP